MLNQWVLALKPTSVSARVFQDSPCAHIPVLPPHGVSLVRVLSAGLCPQPVCQEVQLFARMGVGLLDCIPLALSLDPRGRLVVLRLLLLFPYL